MPGTALVMGVRKPAGGAITSRSVCGVNANAGSPGKELLAGVVAGLAVVRSLLSRQTASAILVLRSASRRSHRVAVNAEALLTAKRRAAKMPERTTLEEYMLSPTARGTRRSDLAYANIANSQPF